ncbi:MAG TPA: LytTR family DNA-binding domain-containing protein [Saprospiraceae bacterium]|nr:LytTR family DNA-binding domain-containing protein [Saprospiraceae bacterium]HMQ81619.1 LytTR family DNA-binding domain-containing protein [Saprospiraceae bacterium]
MSFRKLLALVVEDEAPIRRELIVALNETPELEVASEADSVEDAFELIKKSKVDVLFLDIKLIGGTAFQLLSMLKREGINIPPVVINTGYRDFDLAQRVHNEFGKEVIAILKKPFYEDWERHQEKIMETLYLRQQQERMSGKHHFVKKLLNIQDGRQSYLVNPDDVVMVRTGPKGQGRTEIVLEKHTLQNGLSLSQMLAKMPPSFLQVNRFEAINLNWISVLDHNEREILLRNGETCSIGGGYYQAFCKWME